MEMYENPPQRVTDDDRMFSFYMYQNTNPTYMILLYFVRINPYVYSLTSSFRNMHIDHDQNIDQDEF